jgi:clan AA aspartic protease (TIGR02281 family)
MVPRLKPDGQIAARRLVTESCNVTVLAELIDALDDNAEYSTIIKLARRSATQCGPNDEMILRAVLRAQMRNSDFASAEDTANQIVAIHPANPSPYAWRADVREKRGNIAGALTDMETSLSLFPDPSDVAVSVYYRVARLEADLDRPCDAVVTLRDYIAFNPQSRRTQQLTTIMEKWKAKGACPPLSGTGSVILRFDPKATSIVVPVEVNGVQARMAVDTGASDTALSMQLAARAHIESSAVPIETITANGKVWSTPGRAASISVGQARLANVPVLMGESYGDDVDGLLGLSFLGNFRVQIDRGSGTLELAPLN